MDTNFPSLHISVPGDSSLHVLTPTLLELSLVNTKQPDPGQLDAWDWVTAQGNFAPPSLASVKVVVNGQTNNIAGVGFKRRPFYAPQADWDLRVGNYLYLQLTNPIPDGRSVQVINDGSLWSTNVSFTAVTDPLRFSPAIHVNQEGYVPTFPKKAIVGYYLGNLGELAVPTNTFSLVNVTNGAVAFTGALTLRQDVGYSYTPTPYQSVYEADFSSFTVPGQYYVVVPGMGASPPFWIYDGIGMDLARLYALGLFHQRSAFNVAMPFTRFTHAADHLAPALVPTNASAPYTFTWTTISNYAAEVNPDNPAQTAPILGQPSAQLYPFTKRGPLDVSGGHFEAGDYSKPTWNSAQIIHVLMFAVDTLPGVAALDNLGLPESGDGISDVLQEAKWEADFLAKMQDTDGGFFYQVYPLDREYEYDVLPENGDPQVLWPKNTASTAAAVAALAQCASSPHFKQAYPQAASNYWAKAQLGWKFLTNAIAVHGLAGAYQKVMHFDDDFTDKDERAWAACEMFLATGDTHYQTTLESWFPDPTDPATTRWGWWRMFSCYGNCIRDYASAVKSGRLQSNQLDAAYFAKCVNVITNCGNDNLTWSQDNAYGTSFPDEFKGVRTASFYFSGEQAFDLVVAQQFNPNPAYVDAILRNLNYEDGCNPINVAFVTGLGWKRQREIVDQYSENDQHVLPKDGVPISNLQEGFVWTFTYGYELSPLCYPSDGLQNAPYPIYDRWCDFFNVTTEASTTDTSRGYATALWLAAQTASATKPWRSTNATIIASLGPKLPAQQVTVTLQVADTNLAGARITWEGLGQEPTFGGLNYTFSAPAQEGPAWIEAEVQWPDGRRAFATNSITVSAKAPPQLCNSRSLDGGGLSFLLLGAPQQTYVIQSSTNLLNWQPMSTNTLSASGQLQITNFAAPPSLRRFYRALKLP